MALSPRWIAAVALATPACSAMLGLDAPSLDPCETAPCADATTVDASPTLDSPAGDDGASDAAIDRGPILGVRCGGGAYPVIGCTGQTPVCCQVTDDAGVTSYECRASSGACEGYVIACSTNNGCPGNDVCCKYSSGLKCTSNSCPNGSLVCEPDGAADQCPTGWTCSATAVNDGVDSPYFLCSQ